MQAGGGGSVFHGTYRSTALKTRPDRLLLRPVPCSVTSMLTLTRPMEELRLRRQHGLELGYLLL